MINLPQLGSLGLENALEFRARSGHSQGTSRRCRELGVVRAPRPKTAGYFVTGLSNHTLIARISRVAGLRIFYHRIYGTPPDYTRPEF